MSSWRLHQAKLAAARMAAMYLLPLRAVDRGAGQLAVGQVDAVLLRRLAQHGQGVVADLVAQARASREWIMTQTMSFSRPITAAASSSKIVIDDLHFEEVVARAERAALFGAARHGVDR